MLIVILNVIQLAATDFRLDLFTSFPTVCVFIENRRQIFFHSQKSIDTALNRNLCAMGLTAATANNM